MYQILAVESMEAVKAITPVESLCASLPATSAWLDPENIGLIVMGPDGPIGGVLLTPCRYVVKQVIKYRLKWLYVLPEHRGHGLGRRLTQAAAAEASKRGASTILIAVRPNNETGISWSERLPKVSGLGFVVSLDRCGL